MKNVEKIMMEDGRMAERRVTLDDNGDTHIELWAEEPRNLKLESRIVEKHATIVSERKIEMVDEDGQIVNVKVESVDPKSRMELVQHIGLATDANVSKYATKEELKEVVVAAVSEIQAQGMNQNVAAQTIAPFPPHPFMNAQSVVATNVESKSLGTMDMVLMGVVGIAGIVLAYTWFLM
jgi:lysozyme family protein